MKKRTEYRHKLWLLSAIILIFSGTGPLICQNQAQIDSLEILLKSNRLGDEELTGVLLELTKAYGYSAPVKSIEFGLAALDLSRKTRNQINEALALRSIGVGNHFLDRYDIAKNTTIAASLFPLRQDIKMVKEPVSITLA